MRQRGPTATALSPGLYMDGVRVFSSGTVPSAPTLAETAPSINPPGVFATTMPPKLLSISPVLSRIQSPIQNRLMTDNTKQDMVYGQNAPRTTNMSDLNVTPNRGHNRSMLHTKLRKKTKNKRIRASQQTNGESNRKVHPLKMTIRRTSQTHKVASDVRTSTTECTKLPNGYSPIVTLSDLNRTQNTLVDSTSTLDIPSTRRCASPTQGTSTNVKTVTYADASTSTSGCAAVTEPNHLGPCEPGTKVVVEGIVWLETTGMLVLNIQWRGRSYMGTLLDASKHSFAPSCLDNGTISALSLLRGQRGWSRGSSGRFRTRGVHHFHHHHHHRHGRHHRHNDAGASMTTRAAAAAAAAAASGSNSDSVPPTINSVEPISGTSEVPQNSISTGQSRFAIYDMDLSNNEVHLPVGTGQRGAKRRRRRGTGFSRPYRRVTSRLNRRTETPSTNMPPHLTSVSSPNDLIPKVGIEPMEYTSATAFTCPFPGCKKDFPDLVSMRYHFSLGHSNQSQPDTTSNPSLSHLSSEHTKPELMDSTPSEQNSHPFYNNPSGPSSPPPLGRADSLRVQTCDSKSAIDDRFDDNLAPPRLDRVVSISDSSNGPSKNAHSPDLNDEPPAPSPAYSDISDDGTVPAEHNISFGESAASKVVGEKMFSSGQSIFSPVAAPTVILNPHLQAAVCGDNKLSPSTASPLLKHSPNVVPGTQNGFYFPVRILSPQLLATGQSSPCHIPSPASVMPAHTLNASVLTRSPHDRKHGESGHDGSPGFSAPSIPLSAYAPLVQQTPFLVHTPQPLGATVPSSLPAVYIPGVNSFSIPPSHLQLPQPPSTLTPLPNTGVVNLCITDQGNLSTVTPQLNSAVTMQINSDPGSNSPRLTHHVRHPSGSKR